MITRTNHAIGKTLETAYEKGLASRSISPTGFNPKKLLKNTLACNNTHVVNVKTVKRHGKPNQKRDLEIEVDAQVAGHTRHINQGISLKRCAKGKGASNQTHRGWPDQACESAELGAKALSKSGTNGPTLTANMCALLGLGTYASRIASKSKTPVVVDPKASADALATFNASGNMQQAAIRMALATLDKDFTQAQLAKPSGNQAAGLLAIHMGQGHSNHMRGTHVMIIVSKLRNLYENSLANGTPLFLSTAICNGKGRAIHIDFCETDDSGKAKTHTFMSIKRKGSKIDPYCDHAQFHLNLRGTMKLIRALERKGTFVHSTQKV